MDRVQYFDSSTSGIKRFKTCQIYLCAFFLSDIANVSGRDIPSVFLTGDQYNTSKCTWHTYRALLPIFGGLGVSSSRKFSRIQYPDPTNYQSIFPLIVIDASVDFDISS